MENIKQYIVLRKDVKTVTGQPVSAHKLAVMTAHASMAFLSHWIIDHECNGTVHGPLDSDTREWITGIFTKILLEAKNLGTLEKIVKKAEEAGFVEGKDFFCIRDNCLVETMPDEGSDRCFIAIGFRPMHVDTIKPIVKRLQVYK